MPTNTPQRQNSGYALPVLLTTLVLVSMISSRNDGGLRAQTADDRVLFHAEVTEPAGAFLPVGKQNFFTCPGTGDFPLLHGALAQDTQTPFLIYEYNNKQIDPRNAVYPSNGWLATRAWVGEQYPLLRFTRGRIYYVWTTMPLRMQCGKGLSRASDPIILVETSGSSTATQSSSSAATHNLVCLPCNNGCVFHDPTQGPIGCPSLDGIQCETKNGVCMRKSDSNMTNATTCTVPIDASAYAMYMPITRVIFDETTWNSVYLTLADKINTIQPRFSNIQYVISGDGKISQCGQIGWWGEKSPGGTGLRAKFDAAGGAGTYRVDFATCPPSTTYGGQKGIPTACGPIKTVTVNVQFQTSSYAPIVGALSSMPTSIPTSSVPSTSSVASAQSYAGAISGAEIRVHLQGNNLAVGNAGFECVNPAEASRWHTPSEAELQPIASIIRRIYPTITRSMTCQSTVISFPSGYSTPVDRNRNQEALIMVAHPTQPVEGMFCKELFPPVNNTANPRTQNITIHRTANGPLITTFDRCTGSNTLVQVQCNNNAPLTLGEMTCAAGCQRGACVDAPIRCGDGYRDVREECDDGERNGVACVPQSGPCEYCDLNCRKEIVRPDRCGDGWVTGGEECDDGNTIGGDGCSATCRREFTVSNQTQASCIDSDYGKNVLIKGDARIRNEFVTVLLEDTCLLGLNSEYTIPVESCSGAGCLHQEAYCSTGDARREISSCPQGCFQGVCAHPTTQMWQCQQADDCSGTQWCRDYMCIPEPLCGDGYMDGAERCDDRNTVNGDGCSADCQIETGYICEESLSVCRKIPTCGNGIKEKGICTLTSNNQMRCIYNNGNTIGMQCTTDANCDEQCDDGNNSNNDSCLDGTYGYCREARCGDRFICSDAGCTSGPSGGPEECDDGNTNNNDSCNTSCRNIGSRAFVTNSIQNGNLGGLAGADAICQAQAAIGGHAGNWKAILSDRTIDARDRLVIKGAIYSAANPLAKIADSEDNLWNGILQSRILHGPAGNALHNPVFTGSNNEGRLISNPNGPMDCNGWASASLMYVGRTGATSTAFSGSEWISHDQQSCAYPQRLYCITVDACTSDTDCGNARCDAGACVPR